MKLRAINGPQAGTEYQLSGMSFSIGREEGNDIIIPVSSVSRRHCRFLKNGEIWSVEDLQSLNGVYVNGMKIKVPTDLYDGDVIRVHEAEFRVEDGPARPGGVSANGNQKKSAKGCGVVGVLAGVFLLLVLLAALAVLGAKMFSGGAADKPAEEVSGQVAAEPSDDGNLLSDNALEELKAEPQKPAMAQTAVPQAPVAQSEPSEEPPKERQSRRQRPSAEVPIVVSSNPEGAVIYIDKRHCGVTPALVKGISEGRHTLELSKRGYELFRTQIETPDSAPSKPYRLILKPGVVLVNTDPAGAWVWEGRRLKGVTPLIIEDLAEGPHELDIRGPGCERHVESVEVTRAKGNELNIALKSLLGGLELTSQPPGCSVYLNGVLYGRTEGSSEVSSPLAVKDLLEGRYLLKVEHSSGVYYSSQVAVKRGETAKHAAKLWLPTHKLVLKDGREVYGKLAEKADNGDVVLEMVNSRREHFINDNVEKLEELDEAALKDLVEKSGNEFKFLMGNGGQMENGIMRASDFIILCDNTNEQTFKGYIGRAFRLSGVPSALMKEKDRVVITFGMRLKCTFAAGTADKEFEAISDSKDKNEQIVLQGTLYGRNENLIFLTNCVLLAD